MQILPGDLPWRSFYKLMAGTIVPRPIGWIATINQAGQPNLAPFSFFNAVSSHPPFVLFCPSIREVDGQEKDSLRNARETGEFVVNIVTEDLVEAMNRSAGEYPEGVSEFALAGVTPAPSRLVRAPRVLESPVNYECQVHQIVNLGDQPGSASVVIGRVVCLHIADELLVGERHDKVDLARLRPVGRLVGSGYCRLTDTFDLERPGSFLPPISR